MAAEERACGVVIDRDRVTGTMTGLGVEEGCRGDGEGGKWGLGENWGVWG